MTIPHCQYLFVDGLPEGQGGDFEIIRDQDNYDQQQFKYPSSKFNGWQNYSWVNLPPGPWQYLCLASEAGEEVAMGIVDEELLPDFDNACEMVVAGYTNYDGNGVCDTSTESLSSLLRSLNLKGEVAILKKVK